jgi:hypothetical protein
VARNNLFSFYYSEIVCFFAQNGGFEKIIYVLKNKEKVSFDLIHISFFILSQCSTLLHKDYACYLGNEIKENIFNFINELNNNELRNLKKESLDLINKVLKIFLNVLYNKEERMHILEQFNINFSVKMLKSSSLEKRISVHIL